DNKNNDLIIGDIYTGGSFAASGTTALVGENGSGVSTVTYKENYSDSLTTPPNKTQGEEAALDLKKDPFNSNKTPWETKAEAQRSTTTRKDNDGFKYIDVAWDLDNKGSLGTWKDGG